ncbi:MAG: hypothetical protein H7Z15_08345 [Rhizobacter sp.]|nr:hypothetical protein [Rhizobacter sp.]
MNTVTSFKNEAPSTEDVKAYTAGSLGAAVETAKQGGDYGLDMVEHGIAKAREKVPSAFNRAAAQVDDITRRGLERARQVGGDVRHQAGRAGDSTVAYIKDEPVKSVLMAVAAGATVAGLMALLMRSRSTHR